MLGVASQDDDKIYVYYLSTGAPNAFALAELFETLKMFNLIMLKGNVTDETANTRICTTVSEGGPQTTCFTPSLKDAIYDMLTIFEKNPI